MEKILFLAHVEAEGAVSKTTLEGLRAAVDLGSQLGAALCVGLVGEDVQSAADSMAGCGAATFYAVTGPEFGVSRYATDAAAAEALVRVSEATLVLGAATSRWTRALPGAAERVEGRIDTQITGIEAHDGEPRAERWYYRRRLMATFSRSGRPWFLLVSPGSFEPWTGESGSAALESVEAGLPQGGVRTQVVGEEAASTGPQTIRPDADLLFVAGAGWTKKQADGRIHVREAEELIRNFLEMSRASLGSSKSLVDQSSEGEVVISFMTHLNQVGQTGSTPRHPKGLATCCHGEEPHVVGWRFIEERRAVNLDPNCGWARGKADVLYVADAFEVMAKVNELLSGS
jgi:electron transfer flavoprotein alpha subunit